MLEPIKSEVTYEAKADNKIHYMNLEGVFERYGNRRMQQGIVQYRVSIPGEFAEATLYKLEQNGQNSYLMVADFHLDAVPKEELSVVVDSLFTEFLANLSDDSRKLASSPPISAFRPNGQDRSLERQCWMDDIFNRNRPRYAAMRISGGA